ncbi:MAG: type II toxin-antitoxin system PemK/MazF family toxin [Dehalococcoidia bacterium]
MAYERGDVVLVPFPFTNLAGAKARPAIVVSAARFNSRDVVLVAVTSQLVPIGDPLTIDLPPDTPQFAAMGLRKHSAVLVGKLVSLDQTLPYRAIGTAGDELLREVDARLEPLLGLRSPAAESPQP